MLPYLYTSKDYIENNRYSTILMGAVKFYFSRFKDEARCSIITSRGDLNYCRENLAKKQGSVSYPYPCPYQKLWCNVDAQHTFKPTYSTIDD